jgi:Uma2 family endonuclease
MNHALPSRGNDRQAEVSFVSYDRWPKSRRVPNTNAWHVVPELVAEAVGPNDKLFDVLDKTDEYFENGVKLVWLVVSNVERVYILTSPTRWTVLNRTDTLTGGDVVPGFTLPLVELFPEYPEETAP